jgi:uncharacterized membrane protein YqiK
MIVTAIAALAALVDGCQVTKIKRNDNGDLEASIMSHWLQREVNKCEIVKTADGYKFILNGYKSDASEQLPAFTREMWAGIGILGRLAGAVANPAVASVPLTSEAASADDIAKLTKAAADAKAEATRAKAELAKAKAEAKAASASTSDCPNGECEL